MKSLFCYEKAAELAILYVGEIEKNIVGGGGKGDYFPLFFAFFEVKTFR